MSPQHSPFLPSRRLPLAWFGFAYACLVAALGVLAFAPERVSGFYYQPRTFGVVHLLTLGFISGSILGALYLVAPLAFRVPLRSGRLDWAAFVGFAIGTLGMASHFWIDRPIGMLWAAPLPVFGLAYVGGRLLRGLRHAPLPGAVKLHASLACINVLLAGSLGFALGLNKVRPFVPLPQFAGVIAHAHLAVVGWALMMVMAAGHRLLPMFLPAAMSRSPWDAASAVVTEAGLLGFVAVALARGEASGGFALAIATGVAIFLGRVAWMLGNPRPAPKALPRPDWGIAHVLSALLCLLACLGLGIHLAYAEASERTLQLAKAYGALGLLGFLSQMIVGIENRLLPMAAWLWSFAEGGYGDLPASQYETPSRPLQAFGFACWTLGLPLLCWGLYAEVERFVSIGAASMLLTTLAGLANAALVMRRARRSSEPRL